MGFTMYGLMHFEMDLLQYVAGRAMDDYINDPHLSPWSKQSSSYGHMLSPGSHLPRTVGGCHCRRTAMRTAKRGVLSVIDEDMTVG